MNDFAGSLGSGNHRGAGHSAPHGYTLSSFKTTSDRLTWAGDVLVGATLPLAAIAAIVALVAYAVSTGLPDIGVRVYFRPLWNLVIGIGSGSGIPTGIIWLRNQSGYSAQNPAVIVRLHEMSFRPSDHDSNSFERKWALIDSENNLGSTRYTAVQWDGGPTYSIHGHSTRRLPDLVLEDLRPTSNTRLTPGISLTVEILAEGYRKVVSIPLGALLEGELLYLSTEKTRAWL
jgi:hypothetical protein